MQVGRETGASEANAQFVLEALQNAKRKRSEAAAPQESAQDVRPPALRDRLLQKFSPQS